MNLWPIPVYQAPIVMDSVWQPMDSGIEPPPIGEMKAKEKPVSLAHTMAMDYIAYPAMHIFTTPFPAKPTARIRAWFGN